MKLIMLGIEIGKQPLSSSQANEGHNDDDEDDDAKVKGYWLCYI